MGRLEGKVAFITGAARGQGRSHALKLAEEGADIIAVDICKQIPTVPFPMSTPEDLAVTVKQVEALGRRIVATEADVRDFTALKAAVDRGVSELGRLDIVLANAGMGSAFGKAEELSPEDWADTIGVNLTGVWHTAKVAIPHLKAGGAGGSIVITSSCAAVAGAQNMVHYVAAKTGNLGLMKALAAELAADSIRVNAICPGNVNTTMIHNDALWQRFRPDLENPGLDDVMPVFNTINALPVPWVEPVDITNAVLFLVSDEARYVTGINMPVEAGFLLRT